VPLRDAIDEADILIWARDEEDICQPYLGKDDGTTEERGAEQTIQGLLGRRKEIVSRPIRQRLCGGALPLAGVTPEKGKE
jgi:hypothetical protein